MKRYLRACFALDLRSLSLFRVLLGFVVLVDLWLRSRDLGRHYSDGGLFPRTEVMSNLGLEDFSLHFASGTVQFQALVFAVHGLVGLAFLLGLRTKVATVALWLLTHSLHARALYVTNFGDQILRFLLLWSIFLPLGNRFSLDHALDASWRSEGSGRSAKTPPTKEMDPTEVTSVGSVAFVLQFVFIYVCTGLLKTGEAWTQSFDAIYYALSLGPYQTSLGLWLTQFPLLLKGLTIVTLVVEMGAPLLLLVPRHNSVLRLAVCSAFIGFHLTLALTIANLGVFPYLCMAGWTAFLPPAFWHWVDGRLTGQVLTLFYDRDCGFCRKSVHLLKTFLILPRVELVPAQLHTEALDRMIARRSWVIRDGEGLFFGGYEGFLELLARSPFSFVLARPLGTKLARRLGQKVYDGVSRRRKTMSKLSRSLVERPLSTELSLGEKVMCGVFLGYVALSNAASVQPRLRDSLALKNPVVGIDLALDQRWAMFAPSPLIMANGWFVAVGTLSNGDTVDLFAKAPATLEPPKLLSTTYQSARWMNFLVGMVNDSSPKERSALAEYLCRSWEGPKPLQSVELVFMQTDFRPDRSTEAPKRVSLHGTNCGSQPLVFAH